MKKLYDTNGLICEEISYKNGKIHGMCKSYDDSGEIYSNGKIKKLFKKLTFYYPKLFIFLFIHIYYQ